MDKVFSLKRKKEIKRKPIILKKQRTLSQSIYPEKTAIDPFLFKNAKMRSKSALLVAKVLIKPQEKGSEILKHEGAL